MNAFSSRALALILSAACLPLFLAAPAKPHRQSSATRQTSSSAHAVHANAMPQPAQASNIARGRYLVEQVAMCGECHTPRDASGDLDNSRRLEGATIWIKPVHATLNWAEWAPRLAGLPSFTDDQTEQILEKGIGPNGAPIRPPMHVYHMNHEDAAAIIAYLRSLGRDSHAHDITSP